MPTTRTMKKSKIMRILSILLVFMFLFLSIGVMSACGKEDEPTTTVEDTQKDDEDNEVLGDQ